MDYDSSPKLQEISYLSRAKELTLMIIIAVKVVIVIKLFIIIIAGIEVYYTNYLEVILL